MIVGKHISDKSASTPQKTTSFGGRSRMPHGTIPDPSPKLPAPKTPLLLYHCHKFGSNHTGAFFNRFCPYTSTGYIPPDETTWLSTIFSRARKPFCQISRTVSAVVTTDLVRQRHTVKIWLTAQPQFYRDRLSGVANCRQVIRKGAPRHPTFLAADR